MTIKRISKDVIDNSDREVKLVTLGKSNEIVAIFKSDYDLLMSLGLSPLWTCLSQWKEEGSHQMRRVPVGVQAYCKDASKSGHVSVARVLLDAGNGEIVKYRDGNPLNLRSDNVYKVDHKKGSRRDRLLVVASSILEGAAFGDNGAYV